MRAMILAAGKGTRLAPLTDSTPKPMLPVAGKPLIEWQVESLARAGVTECVINLHHLGDQIERHLGNGERFNVQVFYSYEAELLETGGAIVKALPWFRNDPFWLVNGDIWTDFDFSTLPRRPDNDDLAHLVLTPTPDYREAGDFEFSDGRITGRGDTFVYCGIALLHPALFAAQTQRHFSLRDLYFELIASGRLAAQVHTGGWYDIGTLAQYQALQTTLAKLM